MSDKCYHGYTLRPPGIFPIKRGIVDASELPPPLQHVFREYGENLAAPFVGLTSDGAPRPELFPIRDTGISNSTVVDAACAFIDGLDAAQRTAGTLPVDANEWRAWINAFAPHPPHGILLDELSSNQQDAAMAIFRAAMSERGFDEVRKMMKTNAALGEMVGGYHDTLREWMYWLTIFGTPSAIEPWGFQLYGHHCCVNIFVLGGQLTISPMFLGTEPRIVEEGTHAGLRSFDSELALALDLMASLSAEQRATATLSESVQWDDLPTELAHPTEGRMRGSVARDNAVVPLDGIPATKLDPAQRDRLLALVSHYVGRLPDAHARLKMADVEAHLDETSFAWAGEHDIDKPFYYKVQSPVIFIELDSHSGIFIGNDDPEPFHIHNIVRTPNGNDYGRALLAAHAAS